MGKKRIAAIDLTKKEVPGKKKVSGKQQGRLTDMGEIMLQEMEAAKKKAESTTAKTPVETKKAKPKPADKSASRPVRHRSKRYQALRKLVKPDQTYPLSEAIDLLKKMANSKFNETVELHLVVREPGKKTEKKAPLAHIKIGKIKEDKKKLLAAVEKTLKSFDLPQIQKAVLTATMSPGIKLQIGS